MMKRIGWFLLVLTVLLVSGCSTSKDTSCSVEEAQDLLSRYIKQDYTCCADSYTRVSYNNLNEQEQQEFNAVMDGITVSSVEASGEDTFKCVLSIPNAESTLEAALTDSGFLNDFQNAGLSTEEDAYKNVVVSYLTSILQQKNAEVEKKTFSISVTKDGDVYKLASDAELLQAIKAFVDFDGVSYVQSAGSTEESSDDDDTGDAGATSMTFTSVDSDKSFMFQQNGARFLVHDISIVTGADAIKMVQSLSNANASLATNDTVYYIKYSVKNLSSADAQVTDCFKLMNSDNRILANSGVHVTGLTQLGAVPSNGEIELSTFLVGSSDARLIWYDAGGTTGYYVLNIVQ